MHGQEPPGAPPVGRTADEIASAFDKAWQQGTPRLEDFVGAVGPAGARRQLLQELVKIDLEYRWRHAAARPSVGAGLDKPPLLEEYLRRYPELGSPERLALDLIGEEYRVRRYWGSRPSHAEYLARFGQHGQHLTDSLRRIDAELAEELEGTELTSAGKVRLPPLGPEKPARATPVASVGGLVEMLRQCGLLGPAQSEELARGSLERFPDPHALAKELLCRDWLTPYQVNQLLQGRGHELIVGPYRLLERLGAGGAGQVFKARHQKMDRLVALKILHKELLADPEAVGRFMREIQLVSRLDHPNLIPAYDAGRVGSSYFLAMKYVEGTDLGRLVKKGGPLLLTQACEYMRQAALGLQHLHVHGLVHRDVKPHNLMIGRDGIIKVADLGLARSKRGETTELTTGTLTPAAAGPMGTLDYLAPEQALDFHAADIRADIYSLGCTFWFLLMGQPPFPGRSLAETLMSHQTREPAAIEKARSDVPPGLAAVLRRMLAKRPEDRYRTPAEVADALAPYSSAPHAPDLEFDLGGWSFRARAYTTWEMLCKFAMRNKAFTAMVVLAMVMLAWSSVVNYRARRDTERTNQKYEEERKRTLAAVPAFVEAARLAVDRQRVDNALAQLNVALDYDPHCSEARLLKGQVLIVQKEFGRAKQDLERYLRQQPQDTRAARLVELCGRKHPDEVGNLLDLANVFEQQKIPALADRLLTKYGRGSFEVREKLLKDFFRPRVEKAWPGLGSRLSLDAAGIYRLNLGERKEVTLLDALEGMPLTELDLTRCDGVQDLSPLRGMPLSSLCLQGCNKVRDLLPLRGMPLSALDLGGCIAVNDLSPLQGMRLTSLNFAVCPLVRDLTPLQGMRLTSLSLYSCSGVRDLTPLQSMNLEDIHLPPQVAKGMDVLRRMNSIATIRSITGTWTRAEFWKKYDDPNAFKEFKQQSRP
jgi:eukaryotic-like serine/threonine-protein kinase